RAGFCDRRCALRFSQRRIVEPTGRWRDRHAGAMALVTFPERKVTRSPGRRAEKDMDVEAAGAEAQLRAAKSLDSLRRNDEQKKLVSRASARGDRCHADKTRH